MDLDIVKKEVIAKMNLSVRNDTTNVPTYSTALGDSSYSGDEITRNCQSAATLIMQAICETDGHGDRGLFIDEISLTHGAVIPKHYGSVGVPRITPYSGATYTITGKRKSIEDISAYRANPNNFYSLVAHNSSSGGMHSKLAGYYGIDGNIVYFTGFSAVSDLASFVEADYTLLPDNRYPLAIDLAIAKLKKDGDQSNIFDYYAAQGMNEVNWMRANKLNQPSREKTIGVRDSGDK